MKNASNSAHKWCIDCRKTEKTVIEVVKMVRGKTDEIGLIYHKVIFILEGSVRLSSKDKPSHQAVKGKMLFLLAGSRCSYIAMEDTTILLFRIQTPIQLCRDYSLEDLYSRVNRRRKEEYRPKNATFGELDINAQIWQFVSTIKKFLKKGLVCHYWLELKADEFFLLLRIYYTEEEIYKFLYLVLSNDITFSEQVRLHWSRFQTVGELAAFMNLTPKRFTIRFTSIFGQTPYQWMLQGKARILLFEIKSTEKQFKEIAVENGFASESSFTRFCRKEFNKTPTQIRRDNLRSKELM